MSSQIRPEYPPNRSDLLRRITAWEKELNLPVTWLQHYIASSVLTTMLSRATDEAGNPLFVLKGGTAMLMRFGADARATKDFDAAYRGNYQEIAQSLETAFESPLWNFRAQYKEMDPYDGDRLHVVVYRFEVSIKYFEKAFITIKMEIIEQPDAQSEKINAVLDLSPVRLPLPTDLEILEIRRQIGEKWHACTEPDNLGIPNDRADDVYDLLLLVRAGEFHSSMSEVFAICQEVFTERNIHIWPTKITVRGGWVAVWENLCIEQPVEPLQIPTDINLAIAELNEKLFGEI